MTMGVLLFLFQEVKSIIQSTEYEQGIEHSIQEQRYHLVVIK